MKFVRKEILGQAGRVSRPQKIQKNISENLKETKAEGSLSAHTEEKPKQTQQQHPSFTAGIQWMTLKTRNKRKK